MNTTQLTATNLIIDVYNLDLTIDVYYNYDDEASWDEMSEYSDATLAQIMERHPGTEAAATAQIMLEQRAVGMA